MVSSYLVYVLLLAIGFGISVVLAIRILSNPPAYGRASFMISDIAVAIWLFGYAMEMVSPNLEEKILWAKIQYLGIPFVAPGILFFTLEYSGRGSWLTNTKRILLVIIPVIIAILAFENDRFGFIWPEISLVPGISVSPLVLGHGPGAYLITFYSYSLLAMATAILASMALKTSKLYRAQAIVMLVGLSMPWAGSIVYFRGLLPISGLDLTPLMLTFTNLTFLMGFLRVKLIDIMPVAQDTVFHSMTEAVVILDNKERIIEVNPAAQQIFKHSEDYIGDKIPALLPQWDEWAETNDRLTRELEIEGHIYELRTDPILNSRRKQNGQLVILNDVTQRKRYETELRKAHAEAVEANRSKTKLLANVSHDLRTPLNAILGYTEMLRAGSFGPLMPEQENATSEIYDSTNKLLVFINNLIGQAQIETGRILINIRPFNPQNLIEDIHATAQFWAKKKGLILSYDIDPQLSNMMKGDPYWLKQILFNLVNNAMKFTDQGGVYIYLSRVDDTHWSIQVRDTGIGIPQEAHNRIFEAFQQVENSDRKSSGSGLGLSIVRELVALMDGQISLESETGKGSTFTIILPILT
jgi:signal transduction histidine kinase